MKNLPKSPPLLTALILAAAGLVNAQANTILNFSVDMSVQVGLGTFIPGTDQVSARGSFNTFNTLLLTNNPAGANPNLYTGAANDTVDANGAVLTYKYYSSNAAGGWENTADANNDRAARLPATSGATLTLPTVFYGDAGAAVTHLVTFNVNMAQQINLGTFNTNADIVYARGDFNGFGLSFPLINNPAIHTTNALGLVTSNVYVGTYAIAASPNATESFKYEIDPVGDWESPAAINVLGGGGSDDNNRFFNNTTDQTLPLVDFSDLPYAPVATNTVTFQVDLSVQVAVGNYTPGQPVEVRGSFSGWTGGADPLTNNPAAANPNLYSTTVVITDGVGAPETYKFTYGSAPTFEGSTPKITTPDSGAPDYNRLFRQSNAATTVLPVVLFDDKELDDYAPTDMTVTYTVNMNGAVGTDGHVFADGSDTVWFNGLGAPLGYPFWTATGTATAAPGIYQMTETQVGSGIYALPVAVPRGMGVAFYYKYGIGYNGAAGPFDDEAGVGLNHFRVIRATSTGAYTMPQDKFGDQYNEPFLNYFSPGGGDLVIGAAAGQVVPLAWLGRPGAHLQSRTNLLTDVWHDHFETDGTNWTSGSGSTNGFQSSTNWPAAGHTYFRLVKP